MKFALAVLFTLALTGVACAQLPAKVFNTAQKIRFLESSREDIRKLFAKYESDVGEDESDVDEPSDTFTAPGVEVKVSYASGECSEGARGSSPDAWNVKSGKVVKVEVTFEDPVALAEFTLDTQSLTKELRDEEEPADYVEFNKSKGIMFDISEHGVDRIILFPPASKSKSLCHDNTWGKGFYSSKTWFDEFQLDIICILVNKPANVDDLELSSTEVDATSTKTISVVTRATDPENDVLTYNYSVSGGHIRGTGSRVLWDLTGVASGTYTINVGVDDGVGVVGRTITKTVTVK